MARTTFTTITPLPASMTRQAVVTFLHDHLEMIDLNPLVVERHAIAAPPHALASERGCAWYSLTDKIAYLPGGWASGRVAYTCAFHDLPAGLQTHCYAPLGLELRDRWTVQGALPGEPPQPVELGLGAPMTGLYLREDVDMQCSWLMAAFVKKTLKKSHGALVDRLKQRAAEKARDSQHSRLGPVAVSVPVLALPEPEPESEPESASGSAWLATPPADNRHHRHRLSADNAEGANTDTDADTDTDAGTGVPSTGLPSQQQYAGQTLGPYPNATPNPSSPNMLAQLQPQLQPQPQPHLQPRPQPHPAASGGSLQLPSNGQGLGYSGTVYKGKSRPKDYVEYSAMNPYDDDDAASPGGAASPGFDGIGIRVVSSDCHDTSRPGRPVELE